MPDAVARVLADVATLAAWEVPDEALPVPDRTAILAALGRLAREIERGSTQRAAFANLLDLARGILADPAREAAKRARAAEELAADGDPWAKH